MMMSNYFFAALLLLLLAGRDNGAASLSDASSLLRRHRQQEQQQPRHRHRRFLSEELIAGYEPGTDVRDHSRIDLDQADIEDYLEDGNESGFNNAKNVYELGAFSKSIAKIELDTPLTKDVEEGAEVFGKDVDGANEIRLRAYTLLKEGMTSIQLVYMQDGCHVGGLRGPTQSSDPLDITQSGDQIWDKCLQQKGTISISGEDYTYEYSVPEDNRNGRTIAQFSTAAATRMRPDENKEPYFPDFYKFVTYYGVPDYANDWILSAFNSKATNFQQGNADFADFGDDYEARAEAVKKATVNMAVGMYVIRELEDAIHDCEEGCKTDECNDDPVHALDEAVAYYTGSLEGEDGSGEGLLYYALADELAADFRTAGRDGGETTGKSKVNYDVFREFSLMSDKLAAKDCPGARANKERIVQLMTIPLIQGTIRYAEELHSDPQAGNKAIAAGATFAAAVLPYVADCNSQAADAIYHNMKVGAADPPDFSVVKEAFESQYECLGINCIDVGGVWSDNGGYVEGATPCIGGARTSNSSTGSASNVALIAGVVVAVIVILALVYLYCKCCRTKNDSSEVEFTTNSQDNPVT